MTRNATDTDADREKDTESVSRRKKRNVKVFPTDPHTTIDAKGTAVDLYVPRAYVACRIDD